jgi:prevent-host-death family protein
MSETVLTVEDAAARLSELVERVHTSRETAIITLSGRPVARIVPMPTPADVSENLVAFLRLWRTQHPEPDEQFTHAIEESRRGVRPPRDPWE